MNTLNKIFVTAALIVLGYFLFIGLFYVVAAAALLFLGLFAFSYLRRLWHRVFGGGEPEPTSGFTINVQRGWTEREARVFGDSAYGSSSSHGSSSAHGSSSTGKKPSQIKVIDVT